MSAAVYLVRGPGKEQAELVADVPEELELALTELTVDEAARLEEWLRADLELAADWARARALAAARRRTPAQAA